MMKTVNLCAIVAVALSCYLGGLQNCATAQNGYAGPGDYSATAAGQNIEIIPSWDLSEVENPPQSFYSPPVNPESYGNIPSYGPVPPFNDQRNSAYSENYRQGSPHARHANRSGRAHDRRGRNHYLNYQTSYRDAGELGQFDESQLGPPQQYGVDRQAFDGQGSPAAGPEGNRHHGGSHGRCGSKRRGGASDQFRGGRDYSQPNDSQLNRPFPKQLPNNEADLPPSLKVPITRYDNI